jgi:hypothetical protein
MCFIRLTDHLMGKVPMRHPSGTNKATSGQGTGGFGINPQGTIVGSYLDDGNVFHGYQCVSGCGSHSTFTTFNAPGAGTAANQGTITFSINLFGATVGYYVDASNVAHGFVTAPPYRTFASFDPEGSVNTFTAVASALSLEGAVAGTYLDANGAFHGYVRAANGTISEYNITGAGTGSGQGTEGSSISDLGATTGNYIDSSGVNHGFVRGKFGAITTFDVSAAGTGSGQGTVPEGIDLVGGLQDNTSTRAA